MEHLDPAKTILQRIGIGEASQITGRSISRVYRWMYPLEKGGTGGSIPRAPALKLLSFARQNQIPLDANDFLKQEEA